jgi:hypothetical protein
MHFAAVGLALSTIPVLVERGVISREFTPALALRKLHFFQNSAQQMPNSSWVSTPIPSRHYMRHVLPHVLSAVWFAPKIRTDTRSPSTG